MWSGLGEIVKKFERHPPQSPPSLSRPSGVVLVRCANRFPIVFVGLFLITLVSNGFAGDWTHWRGPTENGVSSETGLPEKFKIVEAGKDNLIWSAPYGCRSTPLIHQGRVFFNSHTGSERELEQECIVCLDAETGKLLWQYKFNVFFTDIVSNRVGWTNMAIDPATGNVYCHGTQGLLLCLDQDGNLVWERSMTEEFGRVSGYGGRLSGVAVDGDLVIVPINCAVWGKHGRGGCRFAAFDKSTGEQAWFGSTGFRVLDSFQSTPIIAEIGGQRLVIGGGGDGGIHAFKVATGEKVFSYLFCQGSVNTSPVIDGNLIYIAHGDVSPEGGNVQGRILCVDGSKVADGKPEVVWQRDGIKIKFATPVLEGGRLILNDEVARLHCLDAKTGEEIWKFNYGGGGNVRCSPVLADGKIYLGDSRGRFYILKDDPKKPSRLVRVPLYSVDPTTGNPVDGEIDGSAAIANGKVYFGNGTNIFCIGTGSSGASDTSELQSAVERQPRTQVGKPATLQVFPGEITLSPGQSASFKARLLDSNGRFIRETTAEWQVAPMEAPEATVGLPPPPEINPPALKGSITAAGILTVDPGLGQFGRVTASAEGLVGSARVRVVPDLPYHQDFESLPNGAIPGGWVNSVVKFAVREVDGQKVLVKTATNPSPLAARANAFIAGHGLTDYTIQADMLATEVLGQVGDMGVVANRYSFFLQGEPRQLRMVSWGGLLRIDRSTALVWEPNVWYTLKMTVQQQEDSALVLCKIWIREDEEPSEWTFEVVDRSPNRNGSPAIYARVPPGSIVSRTEPGAEIYFDNVVITPNN
jgi:outer membrane protein assembly factor BamB